MPQICNADATNCRRLTLSRLFGTDSVLSGLTIFYICTVWIPASVVALMLLARVGSIWVPACIAVVVLLAVLWRFLFQSLSRGESLLLGAVVAGSILVAAAVSVFFYDMSGDGRFYHADAIIALLKGVNPIYAPIPAPSPLWSNHYPKATWYFAAFVIHTFHNFQLGKIYTFLLAFACAAYVGDFFRRLGLNDKYSAALAAAAALSPIVAAQLVSYYLDGAMASLLALVFVAIINLIFAPARFDRAIFVLSASLAMAIKFTGGPYVAGAFCVLIATRLVLYKVHTARKLRRILLEDAVCAVASLGLGLLVLGFDPYVTNVQQGLNPLYPVLGANKVDMLAGSGIPAVLSGHSYNRMQQFLISFFSPTLGMSASPMAMKIPFAVYKQELIGLSIPDARLAGWGVLFSAVMLGSLALFLALKGWRGHAPIVLALVLITTTSLMNPECWWARYVPQIALWPIFLLAPGLRAQSQLARIAARGLCALLLCNNLLFAAGTCGRSLWKMGELDRSLAAVVQAGGPGEYWAYDSEAQFHYDQFSGHQGIFICGQLPRPSRPMPVGGFALSLNENNKTDVKLYKASCSSGPPF